MAAMAASRGPPVPRAAAVNRCAGMSSASSSSTAVHSIGSAAAALSGPKWAAAPASIWRCVTLPRSSRTAPNEAVRSPVSNLRARPRGVSTCRSSATPQAASSRRRNWSPWRTVGTTTSVAANGSARYRSAARRRSTSVFPAPAGPTMKVVCAMSSIVPLARRGSLSPARCALARSSAGSRPGPWRRELKWIRTPIHVFIDIYSE